MLIIKLKLGANIAIYDIRWIIIIKKKQKNITLLYKCRKKGG